MLRRSRPTTPQETAQFLADLVHNDYWMKTTHFNDVISTVKRLNEAEAFVARVRAQIEGYKAAKNVESVTLPGTAHQQRERAEAEGIELPLTDEYDQAVEKKKAITEIRPKVPGFFWNALLQVLKDLLRENKRAPLAEEMAFPNQEGEGLSRAYSASFREIAHFLNLQREIAPLLRGFDLSSVRIVGDLSSAFFEMLKGKWPSLQINRVFLNEVSSS